MLLRTEVVFGAPFDAAGLPSRQDRSLRTAPDRGCFEGRRQENTLI